MRARKKPAKKRRAGRSVLSEAKRQLSLAKKRPRRMDYLEEHHLWKLSLLREFIARRGWDAFRVTTSYKAVSLGSWVLRLRALHRKRSLAPWLRDAVEQIPGWSWDPRADHKLRRIQALRLLVKELGGEKPGEFLEELVAVAGWFSRRTADHRRGKLEPSIAAAIQSLPGWRWGGLVRRSYKFELP